MYTVPLNRRRLDVRETVNGRGQLLPKIPKPKPNPNPSPVAPPVSARDLESTAYDRGGGDMMRVEPVYVTAASVHVAFSCSLLLLLVGIGRDGCRTCILSTSCRTWQSIINDES